MIVTATAIESSPIDLTGSVLGGIGFGLAFLGGLARTGVSHSRGYRGAVMSAFYVVAYASLSVPAVVAGALVPRLGLRPTFEVFGLIVAAAALIVAIEAYVTLPVSWVGMAGVAKSGGEDRQKIWIIPHARFRDDAWGIAVAG